MSLCIEQKHRKVKKATNGETGEFRHKFPCLQCDKRFTQKAHLNRHAQSHTGQYSFQCEFCGREASVTGTRTGIM